jgi:hypothetical protein
MPADKSNIGTGRRRQGEETDPDRSDDSRRSQERAIEDGSELPAEHDRGWQPGAHGERGPHREEKPGTRLDLDQADPRSDET